MKYTTNIDTLSALLDRLISENIKLYFFKKDGLFENVKHQEEVILDIKRRLYDLFANVLEERNYSYISEKRTYTLDLLLEDIEKLIKSDIYTGEYDRANLEEIKKDNTNVEVLKKNHQILRSSNELRAHSKNSIDKTFKKLIDDSN